MSDIEYTGTFKVIRQIVDWINNFTPGPSDVPDYLKIDDFDTSVARHGQYFAYKQGDYCKYSDTIYRCKVPNIWTDSQFMDWQWEETPNVIFDLGLKPGYTDKDDLNRAEVFNTITNVATGSNSHAEGNSTNATGNYSHAEGNETYATSESTHAGGTHTEASGARAFAHGYYVTASKDNSAAFGKYNKEESNTIFSVGNGTGNSSYDRANAFEVRSDNTGYLGGNPILALAPPSSDGTYVLKATVSSGVITYSWVQEV